MEQPAKEMAEALKMIEFKPAKVSVFSNVTSEPVRDPTLWPDLLERQLKSPVLWTDSVGHMVRDGFRTFVECGSGEVLCGLIRRIDKDTTGLKVVDPATLHETRTKLAEAALEV
jgi:[acyl-carrier-protein] S-malonyltransferase